MHIFIEHYLNLLLYFLFRQVSDSNRNSMSDSMAWDKLIQRMSSQAKRDTWVNDVLHPSLGCVCICRSYKGSAEKVLKKLKV